jgi:ATP-binding cassette subfamily F protein 3
MTILTTHNLGQSFGDTDLFDELNLTLNVKDRVGLVGPNGVGKTTLLLILAGLQEPSEGSVQHTAVFTLGYLRQEAVLTFRGQNNTIYEEMLSVFDDLRQMEGQMQQLEARMSAGEMEEVVLDEYGRLQQSYEHGGGYQYQVDIKRVLMGLGFDQTEWDTPLTHLSGGQKTRVLLGRLLLEKPDLLILDEPTNHLDLDAVEWLEFTLRSWPGALLIVSHDRYFLDKIVNQVWDLTTHGLAQYKGNYSNYVQQRSESWERELKLFEAEKARLESEISFIKKHIAGGKTDIAKGKLKRLTRDIVLLEEVGVMGIQGKSWLQIGERVRTFSPNEAVQRIQALVAPSNRPPRLHVRLEVEERSGRSVMRSQKLTIGYPDTPLFQTDKLKLERYDCAALIGPNGSGKSTFLKTILGEIRPLSGNIKFGDNVQVGYFAQAHDQLNLERRVLDEVLAHAAYSEQEARNFLAQYLFKGHDVFKLVGDLSGGERGRLAFALLALRGANFLLLDEPTNHLDIPSQEVLQEVLEVFDGTILLVSHDRYLVSRLATQIWELREGYLHVFEGTYEEFIGEVDENLKQIELEKELSAQPVELDWVEEIEVPPIKKERKKKGNRKRELEREMEKAEALLEEILFDLETAEGTQNTDSLPQLRDELTVIQAQLDALTAEYDELI